MVSTTLHQPLEDKGTGVLLTARLDANTINHPALLMTLSKLGPKAKKAVPALKAFAAGRGLPFASQVAHAIQAIDKQ
jgi:hypothetical protein